MPFSRDKASGDFLSLSLSVLIIAQTFGFVKRAFLKFLRNHAVSLKNFETIYL
jgi:hypothetical protein